MKFKNIKKTKILISPAHYYLDDQKSGGELNWAANILKGVSRSKKYFFYIITGYAARIKLNKSSCRLYEVYRSKNNNLSIFNILYFNLKKTFRARSLSQKNNFQLIHHIFPFSIGTTFDLDFILKNKNIKYLIGPIQSSQLVIFNDEYNFTMANFNTGYWQKFMPKMNNFLVAIFQPLNNYLSNLTLKKADRIIVINQHTKKILLKRGHPAEKIVIIPPGIDTKTFKYIPFKKKKVKIIEIITTGWLIKRKGIELIIKAMAEIIKVDKNIRLRIIGDGPQKENLMSLAQKLNLGDYIIFEGFIPHNKIHKYYERAHIFVSMSRSESWGQMYLEAMACGLPIVAAKNIGSKAIIEDGIFGYLIKPEDVDDLAEKIIYLTENPEQINSFGEEAYQKAEQKYDWESRIIPQYLNIYQRLVGS